MRCFVERRRRAWSNGDGRRGANARLPLHTATRSSNVGPTHGAHDIIETAPNRLCASSRRPPGTVDYTIDGPGHSQVKPCR
jgi:hypothetical protein